MKINRQTDALIVVDVQRDFLPGGALAVPDGNRVVPVINALMPRFDRVVLTQDWHPDDHLSFAGQHPDIRPFSLVDGAYGKQMVWPAHCVAGTWGASFSDQLDQTRATMILRKGWHREVDSYSAFMEQDRITKTGLSGYLSALQVSRVFICGLALDYCVAWTAIDAAAAGFEAVVLMDASAAIDSDGSLAAACEMMTKASVRLVSVSDLAEGGSP